MARSSGRGAARGEDAWGPEEEPGEDSSAPAQQQQQLLPSALLAALGPPLLPGSAIRQPPPPQQQQQPTRQPAPAGRRRRLEQQQQQGRLQQPPALQALCLGVLGRHVTQLVEDLEGQLGFLPSKAKAALLAVARRRGELTGHVLAALADEEWTQLDLSGCRRLFASELLAVAPRMPHLQALDVTGCEGLAAGGWRQLARAWPSLAVVRLGGSPACSEEALKALPHILPGLSQAPAGQAAGEAGRGGAAGHGSWEEAFGSDSDGEQEQPQQTHNNAAPEQPPQHDGPRPQGAGQAAAPAATGGDCRLQGLQVLVWPDAPREAAELVAWRCPRVLLNPPPRAPRAAAGQPPPPELVDPAVPLDEQLLRLVGPAALEDLPQGRPGSSGGGGGGAAEGARGGPHIADRFRSAYVEQAARLRDKDRREWAAAQRRQLRSSHALRELNRWLDEPA